MKPPITNQTQCTINFMGNSLSLQGNKKDIEKCKIVFILSEIVWPWISRVLVPVIYVKTLKNDCTRVCAVCQHRSIMIIMHFKFTSLWLFKKFLSYFLLQSNDFLKLIFLLCLFVIQCYMTAWLGFFFLHASRSCSHTNQDVRGLGSLGLPQDKYFY